MKNMNPIFSLKNFRSFGENGADFELAPITVLTGCNSAGKSSLVKAMLLLSKQTPFFNEGAKEARHVKDDRFEVDEARILRYTAGSDIPANTPTTEFKVSFKELGLGRYDKVLHQKSKDGIIDITIRKWSEYLQENVVIKRTFKAKHDVLNEGELIEFSIEKEDGSVIYKYFYNNHKNSVESFPDFIEYTVEWDEIDEIGPIQDNFNRFVDVSEYYHNKAVYNRILNLNLDRHERGARRMEEVTERMNELEVKYGKDQIEEYLTSYDEKTLCSWNDSLYSWDAHDLSGGHMIGDALAKKQYMESLDGEEKQARAQNNFLNCIINDCISPWFIKDIAYVDSSSALVRRLYSVEDENKMCVALNKLVKYGKTGNFVNKWLREKFEIADSIKVVGTEEGIGIMVYLVKGDNKLLLADEGYGITQLVSLLLQIENNINEYMRYDSVYDEDADIYRNKPYYLQSFIAVEEPEVHLHPKYQSLLADMFVEAYQKYNIHFIIETHSEYLIRKLQVMVADKDNALTPNDVSLNYVEKEDGISTNRKIEILEDGRLSEPFGPGFFDEATDLSMRLLKMKMEAK